LQPRLALYTMLKIHEQSYNFSYIIQNGLFVPKLLNSEQKQNIVVKWLLENHKLPLEVNFVISKRKGECRGFVEINDVPAIGFRFEGHNVLFYPLSPIGSRIDYEEWCKLWLYDLRLHASVGILIKCVKQNST